MTRKKNLLNMIEILPLFTPFSQQCSTAVPGQLPLAQAHEGHLVKDNTLGIKGFLGFYSQISMHLCTVCHGK